MRSDWFKWTQQFPFNVCNKSVLKSLIIASIMINIMALAFPVFLLQTYDRVIPHHATHTMAILLLIVFLALIVEIILRVSRNAVSAWADARFEYETSRQAFRKIMHTTRSKYHEQGPGVYFERMNAINNLKDFYAGQAVVCILDIPFILIYLGLIAYIHPFLITVPLVLIAMIACYAWYRAPTLYEDLLEKRGINNRRSNFLLEVLSQIHTVKSLALEAAMTRRYERLQNSMISQNYAIGKNNMRIQFVNTFLAQCLLMCAAVAGGILVIHGQLSIGALAAYILLSARCLQPISKSIQLYYRLQSIRLGQDSVEQLLNLPSAHAENLPIMHQIQGEIICEKISFHYDDDTREVIQDLSLHIPANSCAIIQGSTDSGKSTLLALLRGVLNPSTGRVMVDGKDIMLFDRESYQASIAVACPTHALLAGTIMENLTHFETEKYETRAIKIARMIGLHHEILQLPKGYKTSVGKNALDSLPARIQHLIILGRSILHKPKIFIFDQGTQSLDRKVIEAVRTVIEFLRGESTVIIASDNDQLKIDADKVYELEKGALVCVQM